MKYRALFKAGLFGTVALALLSGWCFGAADENGEQSGSEKMSWVSQPVPAEDVYVEVASNNWLSLSVNGENGRFEAKDLLSGQVWTSNPVDAEEDEIAKGINRTDLYSQILLQYVDSANGENITNSHAGSYRKGGLSVVRIPNGFQCIYNFVDLGITIPVSVTIQQRNIQAEIVFSEIKETDQNKVYNISLYPYLCSASMRDQGWLLAPDGCGALIQLNNGKTSFSRYRQEIYGNDAAYEQRAMLTRSEQVYLPVCGVKKKDAALFAYLKQGSSYGAVNAYVSQMVTSYNTIFFDFQLRRSYTFSLEASTVNKEYDRSPLPDESIVVAYTPLSGSEASLTGMAKVASQTIFGDKKADNTRQNGLFLEIEQSVQQTKSFLGIPYQTQTALTTHRQAKTIVDELVANKAQNIQVLLKNSHSSEVDGKITKKLSTLGKLGSSKEWKSLVSTEKAAIYQSVRFLTFASGGNGASRFFHAVRNQSKSPTRLFEYLRSTGQPVDESGAGYLVSPNRMDALVDAFVKRYSYKGVSLDVNEMGTLLYSDYTRNEFHSRTETRDIVVNQLKNLKNSGARLMANGANDYALPYLDYVYNVPTASSGFYLTDSDVPFYQMVLSGYVGYATPPINQMENPSKTLLKAMESNSDLGYTMMWNTDADLNTTDMQSLFNSRYALLKDSLIKQMQQMQAMRQSIGNAAIVSRSQTIDDAVTVTYDNGAVLALNYSDQLVTIDAHSVKPNSFEVW